jgi:hypothetical protein
MSSACVTHRSSLMPCFNLAITTTPCTGGGKDLPYRCELCGQYQRTAEALTKHFKQLHEREFKKRTSSHVPK